MRKFFTPNWLRFLLAMLILGQRQTVRSAETDRGGTEFFEQKIRPVLVEHCYSCHSRESEKVKGGLWLDTRDGLLKGGETGPAIVPGDVEKSLLIKAVRYADENLQMPPKNKKLSPEQIADLEAWVKMGAPDPRTGTTKIAGGPPLSDPAKVRDHWAFQPVRHPAPPVVKNFRWVKTPIDAFILAKLEEKQIQPSLIADKRTLIRRVTLDLTGLPPTPEEVATFMADTSRNAFAKVVDRLLASPRYGERWARHWLDVARYADTKGYVFEEERRYPYSYTYRDYVIRALNEDLPYDQFLIQQIAADLLPLGEDKRPLAALGFLTLGRRFLNNPPDIIDDRIDVITRGTMALTAQCARCHDHKYDPIPTKDYYSLYGVFASCDEPAEKPLLGDAAMPKEYPEYLAERKKRETELNMFRETKEAEVRTQLRQHVGDYLLAALDTQRLGDKSKAEALARERKLAPGVVSRWIGALDTWSKTNHAIFAPWFELASLGETNFAERAQAIAEKYSSRSGTNSLNRLVAEAFTNSAPASIKEVAERYGKIFADVDTLWRESSKTNSALRMLPDADQEAIRQILFAENTPTAVPSGEIVSLFDVPAAQKNRALKRKLEELDATHPGSPPRAMALADKPTPVQPHVFVRGNPNNQGPEVPRQFLEIVSPSGRQPFTRGSGRLELARAIASRENPLTARVIVNRVWLQHFGAGLVRTPSDFGLRSDPPSHPELLDFLASRFMDDGWSLKKLHRLILLSSTYLQSSEDNPRGAQIDPGNQLLWRMNRQRLSFEAMRDSLLAVSGKLDGTVGGHPVEIIAPAFTPRRTIYGFVERQNLPGMFRTFDFASPDATNPQRFATTVPQQALFMMNSPFIAELARSFVARPEFKSCEPEENKVAALYRLAFQRSPAKDEIKLAKEFLATQSSLIAKTTVPVESSVPAKASDAKAPSPPLSAWEKLAQVLLMSNELVFVD